MYANISYALLSAALIVLSVVHLILLTIHRPQSHCLPEISIFVLFICVNAVVIGIGLSGLRRGDTPAFYYPLGICTAFPLALEMIRLSKIQSGPLTNALLHRLFLGYGFLSPAVKLGLILCSVAYEASVKGTAVVVSIDYMVLAIAGLLFWRGIRGIPSQGPVIREVTIHALLVLVTAGFAAGGLFHDWALSIQVLKLIRTIYAIATFKEKICSRRCMRRACLLSSQRPKRKIFGRSHSFEIMPTRGDSYFVSAGTGKLPPASLSDLMSSWAGVAHGVGGGLYQGYAIQPVVPIE
ncbi:predicted protein [Histoplasma mississippiense (nom. inval.)]|uniref:predicted protein n=1 Tax=Ajellomyces capsulatus (strain NAm1 / WU24) TaxID=2059318 RepID=UPI000157D5CB|nr:predicted protein [Histoplasma mississippiense (nom. inval.)]EDN05467.1 predicted protein [Histoplasma mississippiense (nom. inval.)]